MSKYRKKPVIVEAVQFFYDGAFPVPGVWYPTKDPDDGGTYIGDAFVITIHDQRAYLQNGDWVITEPDGEHHYPCKPDIFAATYEPVEYTASGVEVEPLNWDKAKTHLDYMAKAYQDIGPAGKFGLAIVIMPLQERYARGERTKWLYDDIMEVE